ncbi:MAG: hypothetical protein NTY68_01500 [Candidatus Micrarchaeota archaeon]|nr:hypothetical protein [Candidatus Micrarchaeota archaeon]
MTLNIVMHILSKPLGAIGVLLALVGIALLLMGNIWGLAALIVGIALAFVSEIYLK